MEHMNPAIAHSGNDHERTDVGVSIVLIFGAVMIVTTLFIVLLISWLYGFFERDQRAAFPTSLFSSQAQELPPAPRLQVSPRIDLRDFRAAEDARLNDYGWTDRQNGMVHIPIERAMDLIAQRGLPVATPSDKPAAAPKTGGQNAPAAR